MRFHANHRLGGARSAPEQCWPPAWRRPPAGRPRKPSCVRRLHRPYPLASEVRVAGDDKRTRFILELDRKIELRAFALANPNRIVLDIPQVTFQLPAGVGDASRGLVKAFRYGLVMPGGSRIVMDLKRPAKIEKAYVLDAENGQQPKLIVDLTATDRATFMQGIAAENPQGDGDSAGHNSRR